MTVVTDLTTKIKMKGGGMNRVDTIFMTFSVKVMLMMMLLMINAL